MADTLEDKTSGAPRPRRRPDRKKLKVESAEDRESQARVAVIRAMESKINNLATARRLSDKTINGGDMVKVMKVLGAPANCLRLKDERWTDGERFEILSGLAEEHGVSMAPRESLTISDHSVDVVKKLVLKLSKFEDAALAEKLDAVKDRVEESRIAKLQESGNLVTDPEAQKMGNVAFAAKAKKDIQRRGAWSHGPQATKREEEEGYYDSEADECDASTNRLRYLQFDHGTRLRPRADLLRRDRRMTRIARFPTQVQGRSTRWTPSSFVRRRGRGRRRRHRKWWLSTPWRLSGDPRYSL